MRAHRLADAWSRSIAFAGPLLVTGVLAYLDPGHSPLGSTTPAAVEAVRAPDVPATPTARSGRRGAASDWVCSAFYIASNIGIAFQCFAGGLFFGVGSLFFLAYQRRGRSASIAGYLTWRGFGENFYSFVVTHGAFELTGASSSPARRADARPRAALPGRRNSSARALEHAARGAIVIVYGITAMFAIAAAIEAFWSSARWVPAARQVSASARRAGSPSSGLRLQAGRGAACAHRRSTRSASTCVRARMSEARRPRRARSSPRHLRLGADELRAVLRDRACSLRRARCSQLGVAWSVLTLWSG